ncbi:MAG: PilN domain-containing protein [Nitrospirota bacterium]
MEGTVVISRMSAAAAAAAARLKAIGAPAWKVLTFSPAHDAVASASCLCIEIERGHITALYATRFLSRYRLQGYKRYRFAEDHYPTPEEAASTVALAMRDLNIRKTGIVLSLPKSWVVVKSAELPAAAAENLTDVISYELDRFTPFSADEAVYDFVPFARDKEKVTLMVAAAKAGAVEAYRTALKEAGLETVRITFDLSGMAALCRYISGSRHFVFLAVGERGCKGGAVNDGALAGVVSSDFPEGDDHQRAAAIEAQIGSLAGLAGGQNGAPPVFLSFSGRTSVLKEMLRQRGRYPVSIIDEVDKKMSGITDFKELSPGLVGGALDQLWPEAKGLNLLSRGAREGAKTPLWLTALLGLVIVALIGVYLVIPINIETQRLKEIERQIALRKDEVAKVEKLKKEIEAVSSGAALVESFKSGRPLYVNLIKELTTVLPAPVWLTRVRINDTQVNIEGYAPSATVLIPKLEASKYFRKVEFASPTFRDARQNMDRFQLKMEMEGVSNEKK